MELPSVRDLAIATRQVATKSAINPIQWICALATPSSIAAACFAPPPLNYFFFFLAALPVIYALRAYDHFMKRDPDRLQSERFLLERQMVGKIGINGPDGPEIILSPEPGEMDNPLLVEDKRDA